MPLDEGLASRETLWWVSADPDSYTDLSLSWYLLGKCLSDALAM